jgi:hypothetical protein
MTGISLHMQWPLTSQLRGSVSQGEQMDFFVTDLTPTNAVVTYVLLDCTVHLQRNRMGERACQHTNPYLRYFTNVQT